jgi:hypothetical protein
LFPFQPPDPVQPGDESTGAPWPFGLDPETIAWIVAQAAYLANLLPIWQGGPQQTSQEPAGFLPRTEPMFATVGNKVVRIDPDGTVTQVFGPKDLTPQEQFDLQAALDRLREQSALQRTLLQEEGALQRQQSPQWKPPQAVSRLRGGYDIYDPMTGLIVPGREPEPEPLEVNQYHVVVPSGRVVTVYYPTGTTSTISGGPRFASPIAFGPRINLGAQGSNLGGTWGGGMGSMGMMGGSPWGGMGSMTPWGGGMGSMGMMGGSPWGGMGNMGGMDWESMLWTGMPSWLGGGGVPAL